MTTRDFKTLVVAGGCYWGVEEYYRRLKGTIDVKSGFAQGTVENPTYEAVCSGTTGHAEAVQITYNPLVLNLETILDHLFRIIDPTTLNKQGNDVGTQYRSGIYVRNDDELNQAKAFVDSRRNNYDQPLVIEVEPLRNFFLAPDNHQLYLQKNPHGYCHVNFNVMKPEEKK